MGTQLTRPMCIYVENKCFLRPPDIGEVGVVARSMRLSAEKMDLPRFAWFGFEV